MKDKTRRQIYLFGSLWNLGFALFGLALPRTTMRLMFGSPEAITGVRARIFFAFFWVAVGLFGVGYYLVSRDPDRNEAVVWTGCLGKVIIFSNYVRLFRRKEITLFGFLGGLGDLIWTVLFLAGLKGEKAKEIA
jgi:hypothetical protein